MYDINNVFAKIIRSEIPCQKVYEDLEVLAFHDLHPVAPVHILVIPKEQYTSFDDFSRKVNVERVSHFFACVQKIAKKFVLDQTGYRIVTNHGDDALQTVQHFHVHILGGKKLGPL